MGLYSVIVPEAITNLVTNPSFESGVTGWTAGAGSLAQSSTYAVYGQYSGKYTPAAGTTDGCYYTITLAALTAYAIQVMVLGALGVPYRLVLYDPAGGGTIIGTTTFIGTGDWQQVELLATTNPSTSFAVYIAKSGSSSVAAYYIDGLQVEQKTYCTTYIDGDQPGGTWSGVKHASTSARSAQSRAGGKVVGFEDYDGVYVERSTGMGMPPIVNNVLDLAILPGSVYQNYKVQNRSIILVISANGSSRANLHALRQTLIDLFKPDAVAPAGQAVILRYDGSGRTLQCLVRYDGGLDMSTVDGFHESVMLRLLCVDPFWYEEFPRSLSLTSVGSLSATTIIRRMNGVWDALGAPAATPAIATVLVYCMVLDEQRGVLYVGGDFLNYDGQATCDYIAKYTLSTGLWSPLQTGLNGIVYDMALHPNGTLYIGGAFTNAGGDADADYAAQYNPTTDTFSKIKSGLNGDVHSIKVHPTTGLIWIGGVFTNITRVGYYSGSAWVTAGAGLAANVLDLQIDPATGYVWAAGLFSGYVQYFNGTTWSGALGGGLSGGTQATSLAIDTGSIVYVAGDFTTPYPYLAKWNGSTWVSIGAPTTTMARVAIIGGKLYAAGLVTALGTIPIPGFGYWNGSSWSRFDVDLTNKPVLSVIGNADNTAIYIAGYYGAPASLVVSYPTIAIPTGSATCYPRITIARSGGTSVTVSWIENVTTGKRIVLNATLLDGESIVLDLTPGHKNLTSNKRGNILSLLNPISDLADWALAPGSNSISLLVDSVGSPTITATISWTNVYWSADALS